MGSILKGSNLIQIDGKDVQELEQVYDRIAMARTQGKDEMLLTFATEERVAIHPEKGVPQLYLDQPNVIGQYLHEMKYDEEFLTIDDDEMEPVIRHVAKKRKKVATPFSRKTTEEKR